MTDAAAFEAVYVGFRPMRTQPIVQLTFEVPVERYQSVIDAIGLPTPGQSIHVAIARIQDDTRRPGMDSKE